MENVLNNYPEWIEAMTNNDLIQVSRDTINIVKDFEKTALQGLESINLSWCIYLHLGMTQFDTLDSVMILLKKRRHKDCFALLRSVFESSFFLMLMMHGKRFRETRRFKVIPNANEDSRTARDKTLAKWEQDQKSGTPNYDKIVNLGKEDEDIILVTIEDEGLYTKEDVKKEGPVISKYYFAFDEYDPETRFTLKLPSVSAGNPYPKIADEQWRKQKILYHQYFYISKLKKNLKLNGFLDDEQVDRFEVHYNLLSSFVHPTKMGTTRIGETTYSYPYTPPVMGIARHKLVLLYICKLQALLIRTLVDFFEKINQESNFEKYKRQVVQISAMTKDFWFIYNEPTAFDKSKSDYIKKVATDLGHKVDNTVILYYRNPLKRLADLLIAQGKVSP